MQYTIADFENYSENCSTIKEIKAWAEGIKFSYSDLKDNFPRYINPTSFLRHLKQERHKEFITRFNEDFFDITYSIFESSQEELLQLRAWKERTMNASKVIETLRFFFDTSFRSQSYRTTNDVMHKTLSSLIDVAEFREDDFISITKQFNFSYWGGNSIEYFYGRAIQSNNNSAWKSIENYLERTPFILKNKRMYEGLTFKMVNIENTGWLYLRCTGWNDAGDIKFIQHSEGYDKGTENRLKFNNKDFKSFFKNRKLEI